MNDRGWRRGDVAQEGTCSADACSDARVPSAVKMGLRHPLALQIQLTNKSSNTAATQQMRKLIKVTVHVVHACSSAQLHVGTVC